jgi:predicted amidohydrolase YtcJ
LEFYEKYDKEGKLKVRVYCAVPIETRKLLEEKVKQTTTEEMESNKRKKIRFGAVKGYIDGSIGSHSAAFFEDYCDTIHYNGDLVRTEEELYDLVKESD